MPSVTGRWFHVYMPEPSTRKQSVPGTKPKIRWIPVIAFTILGGTCILGARHLSRIQEGDARFWSSVAVNIGTALVLAAFLFFAERWFVKWTSGVAKETATQVATEVVQAEVSELTERFENLNELVSGIRAANAQARNQTIDRLGNDITRATFVDAMHSAQEIGAIGGDVWVPGTEPVDDLAVQVQFHRALPANAAPWRASVIDAETQYIDHVSFKLGSMSGTLEWKEAETFSDFITRLLEELQRQALGAEAKRLDFATVVQNLHSLLHDAVSARRHDGGAWLSGASVRELLADGWVHTDAGIEVQGHGLAIEYQEPGAVDAAESIRNWEDIERWNPPSSRPEWASEADWARAVKSLRARMSGSLMGTLR